MLGNIGDRNQLQEDDALKTVLSIADSSITIPAGYLTYGALNAEMQLAECLLTSSRFAERYSRIVVAVANMRRILEAPICAELWRP